MEAETFGDELVLTLREPIKLGNLEFTDLTLAEPRGEALCLAEREDAMGGLFTKIARTAGVPPAVAKKMRQRDLQRAANFFNHFEADDEQFEDELVLTLREPIVIDKKSPLAELTLAEPTGETLQLADREQGPWAEICALVAGTSGIAIGAIKKMRQRDLQRARNFFSHFAGEPSSMPSATTPQS